MKEKNIEKRMENLAHIREVLKEYDITDGSIERLILKYQVSKYNTNMYDLLTSIAVLENRTEGELINFADVLKLHQYRFSVATIMMDNDIILNRTFLEQLKLIYTLKKYNYDNYVRQVITSDDIVKRATFEQQLMLVEKVVKSNYDRDTFEDLLEHPELKLKLNK